MSAPGYRKACTRGSRFVVRLMINSCSDLLVCPFEPVRERAKRSTKEGRVELGVLHLHALEIAAAKRMQCEKFMGLVRAGRLAK